MVRLALLAVFLALPVHALALDWYVLPADAWAGDAGVSVEYVYTSGSATGPVIGAAAVMVGPLLAGQPRPIAASQFDGRGATVCVVANSVRGTERSVTVSSCHPFRLAAPALSAPR